MAITCRQDPLPVVAGDAVPKTATIGSSVSPAPQSIAADFLGSTCDTELAKERDGADASEYQCVIVQLFHNKPYFGGLPQVNLT